LGWSLGFKLKIETKLIDGNFIFSGMVLQLGSEESLNKIESPKPISNWLSVFNPFNHEFKSFQQIIDPRS